MTDKDQRAVAKEMINKFPIAFAILAALCYGVSIPFAKLIQTALPPALVAALLYLGAGFGMSIIKVLKRNKSREAILTKTDIPYTVLMILLDIAAPLLLMLGLSMNAAATAALLGNFEIVATSVIALAIFKESIGRRMWIAIAFITLSSILLSVEDISSFKFSLGAALVLAACLCWGVENNCTSKLSHKDPLQIVIVKGFGSGVGALIIARIGDPLPFNGFYIGATLILGFIAYGLSIYFYIKAQRHIGAARTSAYYAFAPFIGVVISFMIFRERPTNIFIIAFLVMMVGVYIAATEKHAHEHSHETLTHEHRHNHNDGHHEHDHSLGFVGEHSHVHIHEAVVHTHGHLPDLHHRHGHGYSSGII